MTARVADCRQTRRIYEYILIAIPVIQKTGTVDGFVFKPSIISHHYELQMFQSPVQHLASAFFKVMDLSRPRRY